MTTDSPVEYELTFLVPTSFNALPLDFEYLEPVIRETADVIASGASDEEREQFIQMLLAIMQHARDQNCAYFGAGALRAEDDTILQATITAFIEKISTAPPETVVAAALDGLQSKNDDRDLSVLELDAGPAVRDLHAVEYESAPFGLPTTAVELQYYLPFPDGERIVLLSLTTPDVDYWKDLAEIMDNLMEHTVFHPAEPAESTAHEGQRDSISSVLNPDGN